RALRFRLGIEVVEGLGTHRRHREDSKRRCKDGSHRRPPVATIKPVFRPGRLVWWGAWPRPAYRKTPCSTPSTPRLARAEQAADAERRPASTAPVRGVIAPAGRDEETACGRTK